MKSRKDIKVWINSRGHLPPKPDGESERYLVTIKGDEVKVVEYSKLFINNMDVCRWEWMNKNCSWEIQAWMPLPSAYW